MIVHCCRQEATTRHAHSPSRLVGGARTDGTATAVVPRCCVVDGGRELSPWRSSVPVAAPESASRAVQRASTQTPQPRHALYNLCCLVRYTQAGITAGQAAIQAAHRNLGKSKQERDSQWDVFAAGALKIARCTHYSSVSDAGDTRNAQLWRWGCKATLAPQLLLRHA